MEFGQQYKALAGAFILVPQCPRGLKEGLLGVLMEPHCICTSALPFGEQCHVVNLVRRGLHRHCSRNWSAARAAQLIRSACRVADMNVCPCKRQWLSCSLSGRGRVDNVYLYSTGSTNTMFLKFRNHPMFVVGPFFLVHRFVNIMLNGKLSREETFSHRSATRQFFEEFQASSDTLWRFVSLNHRAGAYKSIRPCRDTGILLRTRSI